MTAAAVAPEKPPYRIPPTAEILATPRCGLTHVGTFSGCGGSRLGMAWAGLETRWASEFIGPARDTYLANFPGSVLDPRDIREVQPSEILRAAGLREGELDVLEGSPPCASFSSAGRGARGWGEVRDYSEGVKQRTDDLFAEFVRLLRGLMPRAFVAENVAGLVRGAAKGYFLEIMESMRRAGYVVEARLVDAQWLGVPQVRRRTIFVGVRDDVAARGARPAFPDPFPWRYSIREAIDGLVGDGDIQGVRIHGTPGFAKGKKSTETNGAEPSPTVMAFGMGGVAPHQIGVVRGEARGNDITGLALEEEWRRLRPGESSERYFSLVRPDPDEPSPTVTQTGGSVSAASVTHPDEPRKFTIPELKRLSGFPDDFELTGSFRQQWERIGRAVPPPMMRAIAAAVCDQLLAANG